MRNMGFLYKTNEKKRVVIYGAGATGSKLYRIIKRCFPNICILAVVDKERDTLSAGQHYGKIVSSPESIQKLHYDYIILATTIERNKKEMDEMMRTMGVDSERMLEYVPASRVDIIASEMVNDKYLVQRYCELMEGMIAGNDSAEFVDRELSKLESITSMMDTFENGREWYTDKNNKCAYLNIPKSAGSSIIKSVCSLQENDEVQAVVQQTLSDHFYRHSFPEYFKGFRFTFVRNPFERILSCYKNKIEGRSVQVMQSDYLSIHGIEADEGFPAFVNAIIEIPDKWSNVHFKSQYQFIYDKGECLVDYIGRVENISSEYEDLQKRFGLCPLEWINKSRESQLTDYYTIDLLKKVYERYKQDVEAFGYEKAYKDILEKIKI